MIDSATVCSGDEMWLVHHDARWRRGPALSCAWNGPPQGTISPYRSSALKFCLHPAWKTHSCLLIAPTPHLFQLHFFPFVAILACGILANQVRKASVSWSSSAASHSRSSRFLSPIFVHIFLVPNLQTELSSAVDGPPCRGDVRAVRHLPELQLPLSLSIILLLF